MLSAAEVTRLMNERSADAKIDILRKIAVAYETADLSPAELKIAEDVLGLLSHDVEVLVRAALAEAVKNHPHLPRDVALTIARDVSLVSVPFVRVTQALNESDFISVIKEQKPDVLVAIANRREVTPAMSQALVEHGTKQVVGALMENDAAQIHDETYYLALKNFGHNSEIAHAMALRSLIPLSVAQELVSLVSDQVRMKLLAKYDLPDTIVAQTVLQTRNQATLNLISPSTSLEDIHDLVKKLHEQDRLTDHMILTALNKGDLLFFESALSRRSGVTFENVQALVRDRGSMGLLAIYRKAGMEEAQYQTVRLAVDMAYNINPDRIDAAYNFSGSSMKDAIDAVEDDPFFDDGGWTDLTS